MDKITFQPGRYYIGDPSYVINDEEDWEEISAQTGCFGNEPFSAYDENLFLLKGKECWADTTLYGDGTYFDNEGSEYWVDAGILGIIPSDAIEDSPDFRSGYGFVDFSEPFEVWNDDGVFHFGNMSISTK